MIGDKRPDPSFTGMTSPSPRAMTSLPLVVDTTTSWRSVVKLAAILFAGMLLCIVGALVAGQFAAAAGLTIITAILWLIASVGRREFNGNRLSVAQGEVRGYSHAMPKQRMHPDAYRRLKAAKCKCCSITGCTTSSSWWSRCPG